MSYDAAAPVFKALREDLWPAELRGKTPADIERAWPPWAASHDASIRARVIAGDEDSIVHLLFFGTSFTTVPRITSRELAVLALAPDTGIGSLRPRIDALVDAAASGKADERLQLVREVLTRAGVDLSNTTAQAQARQFLGTRARAVAGAGLQRLQAIADAGSGPANMFRDRGLASDTVIATNLGIDRALSDLFAAGRLQRGTVRRVAIVGPGLDFVDKQFGYDFYPPQTIQPFAVIDSLVRSGLAAPTLAVTAFDLSPRVNAHLAAARVRSTAGTGYTIVLPRDVDQAWSPELIEYWTRFGQAIGQEGRTPAPPGNAGHVQVRSVAIRPAVVTQVSSRDLDIVLDRVESSTAAERFDLVIATNVLLYYDVFEQSLALANIAAMLRGGGVLLSNTRLVELPGVPMAQAGHTDVVYTRLPGIGETGDRVFWYVRQ
jgi:SAM-dependent methyltransferase